MQRETDAYFLNASNDTGPLRPRGAALVGVPVGERADGEPGGRVDACGVDL